MNFKYKYIFSSIGLAFLLGLPFILKNIHPQLEIFPAVIMPSGAGKVNNGDGLLEFSLINLYGIDSESGKEKLMNNELILGKIPIQYYYPIVMNEFGIDTTSFRYNINTSSFSWQLKHKDVVSEKERKATKKYLRQKLVEQSCQDTLLIVKNETRKVNTKTQTIQSTIINYEKIYKLY